MFLIFDLERICADSFARLEEMEDSTQPSIRSFKTKLGGSQNKILVILTKLLLIYNMNSKCFTCAGRDILKFKFSKFGKGGTHLFSLFFEETQSLKLSVVKRRAALAPGIRKVELSFQLFFLKLP